MLKAPGTERLKSQYDEHSSNFIFKFNLRCYSRGAASARTLLRHLRAAAAESDTSVRDAERGTAAEAAAALVAISCISAEARATAARSGLLDQILYHLVRRCWLTVSRSGLTTRMVSALEVRGPRRKPGASSYTLTRLSLSS